MLGSQDARNPNVKSWYRVEIEMCFKENSVFTDLQVLSAESPVFNYIYHFGLLE